MDIQWEKIEEFPKYEVSTTGAVREIVSKTVLAQKMNGEYYYVSMGHFPRTGNRLIHELVAQEYCKKDSWFPIVSHINGDKLDNRSSNLKWINT